MSDWGENSTPKGQQCQGLQARVGCGSEEQPGRSQYGGSQVGGVAGGDSREVAVGLMGHGQDFGG